MSLIVAHLREYECHGAGEAILHDVPRLLFVKTINDRVSTAPESAVAPRDNSFLFKQRLPRQHHH